MANIVLTSQNDGERVPVHRGDEIVVRLDEWSSGGYRWSLIGSANSILIPKGAETRSAESDLIGAPGVAEFRFIAREPGEAKLEFKLWRKWEGDSSAIERYAVSVEID